MDESDPDQNPDEKLSSAKTPNITNSAPAAKNIGLSKMDLSAQNSIKNKIIQNKRA